MNASYNSLPDVLVALQSLRVSKGEELTRRDFHSAVLRNAGWNEEQLQAATDEDLRDAYIATLKKRGIEFVHIEKGASSTAKDGIFRYPLFSTETRYVPYHKNTSDSQLIQRLRAVVSVLNKMGFLSSYYAVYVTDDLTKLYE